MSLDLSFAATPREFHKPEPMTFWASTTSAATANGLYISCPWAGAEPVRPATKRAAEAALNQNRGCEAQRTLGSALLGQARLGLAGLIDRMKRLLGLNAAVLNHVLQAVTKQITLDGGELLNRLRTGQLVQTVEIALPLLLAQLEPAPGGIQPLARGANIPSLPPDQRRTALVPYPDEHRRMPHQDRFASHVRHQGRRENATGVWRPPAAPA